MVFWLSIMAACGGYFTFLMGAKFENYYSIKHTQKLERVIYDLHTEKEQFEAANKELLTKKLALPVAQAEIKKLSLANEKLQSQVKKLSLANEKLQSQIVGQQNYIDDLLSKYKLAKAEPDKYKAECLVLKQSLQGLTEKYEKISHKTDKTDKPEYIQLINQLKAKHKEAVIRLKASHDELLQTIKQEHSEEILSLKQRINELEEDLKNWETRAPEFAMLEVQLKGQEDHLRNEEERIINQLELAKQELQMREDAMAQKLANAEQHHEQVVAAATHAIELQNERDNLLQRCKQLESQLSEFLPDEPPIPDDVMDIMRLLASEEIQTEYIDNVNRGGVEIYRFKPLTKISQSKLDTVTENLPAMFDWVDSKPSATVRKGEIIINVDTRTSADRLNQIQREWLPNLAQTESNLAIFGAKGGGKSELAINYISLILEQIPSAKIEWIQPKPDDFSRFEINGNYYKPNFVGFEDGYYGLNKIIELYQHRNAINTEAFKSDKPTPKWSPVFWIIDEFQSLIAEASKFDYDPKQICKDIQTAVSLGRSLQINILLIGQIANVSIYPGWTKASYYQFNTIYLGDMIGVGAGYSLTSEEKKRIESLLSDYRNSGEKFYGLVREANKTGSIMRLPKPKQYVNSSVSKLRTEVRTEQSTEIQGSSIPTTSEPLPSKGCTQSIGKAPNYEKLQKAVSECPECGGIEHTKRGKTTTGKQRLNCKQCGSNFTVEV